jgi:cob(I)alamin adenosyltransferase
VCSSDLPSLDNFILPGGHKDSSKAQIIRAVCRRSERSLVMASETELINKNCIIYINRLSDFLFVLARKINIDSGEEEILWDQP